MSLKELFGKKEPQAAKEPKPLPPGISHGSFLVTAASSVNNEYSWQGFWITGVLTGPGVTPCALLYTGRAHSNKWPEVGQTLPVTMKASVPEVVGVIWAEVPDPQLVGLERAKKIVESMKEGTS